MKRKIVFSLLALAFILALSPSLFAAGSRAQQQQGFRVAFCLPPIMNDFHARMRVVIDEEIAKVMAERNDFQFTAINAIDNNDQLRILELFATQGYDLIAIMPNDAVLLGPKIGDITRAGTPTIVINRDTPSQEYTHFIAGDNWGGGVNAAHYFGRFFAGRRVNIVHFGMLPGSPIGEERMNSFNQTIAANYPNINILGYVPGGNARGLGLEAMSNALQRWPRIDGVYTHDDEGAIGAMTAIRQAGRTDIQIMTGFGGVREVFQMYIDGTSHPLMGTSLYSPYMGAGAVRLAVDVLTGVQHPKRVIEPSVFVTSENARQFLHLSY